MAGCNINEQLSVLALTRVRGLKATLILQLIEAAGTASELFANIDSIHDILPGVTPELIAALSDKSVFDYAKKEMEFIAGNNIKLYCITDDDYPARLRECIDAPAAIYTLGNADLNARRIVSIVGTRHATEYGKDICSNFVAELARLQPDTLIVSGLAFGIDVCAHRSALKAGLPTLGVLAHGLDRIYPATHRNVAKDMLANGGLLTEFMSGTMPFKQNFLQRNRIVAGMADATVVIESPSHGGSLVTASLAQSYARDCFAFPGRVTDKNSAGCNELVSRNRAALITSAQDFVEAMNWHTAVPAKTPVMPDLFPTLSVDEQRILNLLKKYSDGMQINSLIVELDIPINRIMPILFEMEMKNLIKAVAGGRYRAVFFS
ncbi:MAG: DNA-processing protein DprA [Bacteroidaceae bacterium]|nr:DNA-processing protein DprA [Bacteroidaceae bacterium]